VPSQTPIEIAAAAAAGFKLLECFECAANIKKALQANGQHGRWIEIRAVNQRPFISSVTYDGGRTTITDNGRHVGIRVDKTVFDNLHPNGVDFDQWLQGMLAVEGIQVVSDSEF